MKFAFYVQQGGQPREKKFEFEIFGGEFISGIGVVWDIEKLFNNYTDTRVHIEQLWTKENEKQAEGRFDRKTDKEVIEKEGITILSDEEVTELHDSIVDDTKNNYGD
jgi:hypothetical protein